MNICITITKSFKITIHVFSWRERIAGSGEKLDTSANLLTYKVTASSSIQPLVLSPFYLKSFKKLYFYLPGLKCCYIGGGIEIERSAKKLKERARC